MNKILNSLSCVFVTCCFLLVTGTAYNAETQATRPNVLWIYVDDMSDWLGCSGDELAQTPNIDALAAEGIRFSRAYMPSAVCSTTRSALILGRMQTTLGHHNHRTMVKRRLPDEIKTIPELFRDAGYITFNESKDDYNFLRDREQMYSPEFKRTSIRSHFHGKNLTWLNQLHGKQFFGQIQLAGGKLGGETGNKFPTESRVDPQDVTVPPQYPDHPVFRDAIARHYEQIAQTDEQVGLIVQALKDYGLWENTIVLFFTDHGSPLPRSKQFLYEEGLRVPLIVRFPDKFLYDRERGTVRDDLVSGIDITPTTLALAEIEIPAEMEGRNLFAAEYEPRQFVVSARDRCGIAVDRIRAVRSERFLYLKNDMTDRALFQQQYRHKYPTFATLRELYAENKLSLLQASYHEVKQRATEELYDLEIDPHQLTNLAGHTEHQDVLKEMREELFLWELETGDQGRFPEDRESLKMVYDGAKGDCPAPEFDQFRPSKK